MGTHEKDKLIILLDAMTDSMGSSEGQPIEDVIAELKEEGFDINTSRKRIFESINMASQAAKRQQLDVAREERLAAEAKISSRIGKYYNWTKEQLLEKMQEISVIPGSEFSFSYRELETKTEEDLAALLEDLEITEAIEEEKDKDEK